MNHPAKRRKVATERKRRAKASTREARRPITPAGIAEVPATDLDPGAPDPLDLADTESGNPTDTDTGDWAETARPSIRETPRSLGLDGGDLDASFHGLDGGEETPGGSDPTPDQDNVDAIGTALGIEEQDEKPLATTEKVSARDERRWELDPASSDDFDERQRELAKRPGRRRQP